MSEGGRRWRWSKGGSRIGLRGVWTCWFEGTVSVRLVSGVCVGWMGGDGNVGGRLLNDRYVVCGAVRIVFL